MVAFWRQGVSSSQKHLVDLVSHQGKVGGSHTLYTLKHPRWEKLRGAHGNEILRSGNEEVRLRRRENAELCVSSLRQWVPSKYY